MVGVKLKEKPKVQFKVSTKKLSRALKKLNERERNDFHYAGSHMLCNSSIARQLLTVVPAVPIGWRQNWHETFRSATTRHNWNMFLKTLRVASQSDALCSVDVVTRNTFFATFAHPLFNDPKTQRLLLYNIAPCRSEQDIEHCLQTILRTFAGDFDRTSFIYEDGSGEP
uniref:Uncharacterized protein n=1 Tax=Anopheles dirus TaxID=7168 RepID=A0A182N8W7_9DIPT